MQLLDALALGGHASVVTTARYDHRGVAAKRQGVERSTPASSELKTKHNY